MTQLRIYHDLGRASGTGLRASLRRTSTAIGMALAVASLTACTTSNPTVRTAEQAADQTPGGTLLGMAYEAAERGDYYAAIPMFRRAHAKDWRSAEPLIGLGRSLAAIGQYNAALEVFGMAVDRDDESANALRGLAGAQLVIGQYSNAIATYSTLLRLSPNDAAAYSGLAVAFDAQGQHGDAMGVYRQGLAQFPENGALKSNYGLSLVLHGEIEQGLEALEAVTRHPNSSARDRQNLAIAYAISGDYDRAAAMAGIDLDNEGVRANLVYAASIKGLAPEDRMTALLTGSARQKTDLMQPANRVLGNEDEAQVRATLARLLPEPQAAALPEEDTETPAIDPAVAAGAPPLMDPEGWAVQIAAYRKLEHLTPGWNYLSQKYHDLIGGLEPRRSEVTHPQSTTGPSGFYYRLNAGPLTGRAQAEQICAAIKARGGDCWVRPPEPSEGKLPDDPRPEISMLNSPDHEAVMRQLAEKVMDQAATPPAPDTPAMPPVKAAAVESAPLADAPARAVLPPVDLSAITVAARDAAAPQNLRAMAWPTPADAAPVDVASVTLETRPDPTAGLNPLDIPPAAPPRLPQPVLASVAGLYHMPQDDLIFADGGDLQNLPPLPGVKTAQTASPAKDSPSPAATEAPAPDTSGISATAPESLPAGYGANGTEELNRPALSQTISVFEAAEAQQGLTLAPPKIDLNSFVVPGMEVESPITGKDTPLSTLKDAGKPVKPD